MNGAQTPPSYVFSKADKPSRYDAYALSKWEAGQGLF